MSINDALGAYDASIFGRGSGQTYAPAGSSYRSYGNSHDCCLILSCSNGGGGGCDSESAGVIVLVLAAAAAAASALVLAGVAADSYNSAANLDEGRRSADHQDPCIKSDIKKVFVGLESERFLTGSAYLSAAFGCALLVAACALGIMKKGPFVKLSIAGGAAMGGGIVFLALRYLTDPRKAVERLAQPYPPIISDPPPPYSLHQSVPSAPRAEDIK